MERRHWLRWVDTTLLYGFVGACACADALDSRQWTGRIATRDDDTIHPRSRQAPSLKHRRHLRAFPGSLRNPTLSLHSRMPREVARTRLLPSMPLLHNNSQRRRTTHTVRIAPTPRKHHDQQAEHRGHSSDAVCLQPLQETLTAQQMEMKVWER